MAGKSSFSLLVCSMHVGNTTFWAAGFSIWICNLSLLCILLVIMLKSQSTCIQCNLSFLHTHFYTFFWRFVLLQPQIASRPPDNGFYHQISRTRCLGEGLLLKCEYIWCNKWSEEPMRGILSRSEAHKVWILMTLRLISLVARNKSLNNSSLMHYQA